MKTKTGIAFSGGGGKGAYELGAWRALREFGVDKTVEAVAGTSVGGLNGALFLQGDLDRSEKLWRGISSGKILQVDPTRIAKKLAETAAQLAIPGLTAKALLQMFSLLKGKGWFTQDGLRELIRESNACQTVKSHSTPFHVCALNTSSLILEYPLLNECEPSDVESWLLASAAIPVVFDPVAIGGNTYLDGGVLPGRFSDNTPYEILIRKHHCTHIICMHLDNAPIVAEHQSRYPLVKFWNIVPTESFRGGPLAALDFSPQTVNQLINQGYADAVETLQRFADFQKSEQRNAAYAAKVGKECSGFGELKDQARRTTDEKQGSLAETKTLLKELQKEIGRQDLAVIDAGLDDYLARFEDNSIALQKTMFEGISTLASTRGGIGHGLNRNYLEGFWESITGTKDKLNAEIQWNLHHAIYCNQQLIQKLSERHALTQEAISSLSSRLNYVMAHANFATAKADLNRQFITGLVDAVNTMHCEQDALNHNLEMRIEKLESKQHLSTWLLGVPSLLDHKPVAQGVIEIATGFYQEADGEWDPRTINALRGQLRQPYGDSTASLEDLHLAARKLAHSPIAEQFSRPPEVAYALHPAYSAINRALPDDALQVMDKEGIDCKTKLPASCLVEELLCSMRMHDLSRSDVSVKYIENIEKLKSICAKTGLADVCEELERLRQNMSDYRIIVPMVGKFSSGKSTLLNAVLKRDLLETDLHPKTVHASELHFAESEAVSAVYSDLRSEVINSASPVVKECQSNELWFYRRYINSPLLAALGKFILVDTPGLDSNILEHEKALARYVELGDAFIGVLSSETAFDDDSLMAVLGEAYENGKEINIVVTKCGRQEDKKLNELRSTLHNYFAGMEPTPSIALIESKGKSADVRSFCSILYHLSCRFNEFFHNNYGGIYESTCQQIGKRLRRAQKLLTLGDEDVRQDIANDKRAFRELKTRCRRRLRDLRADLDDGMEAITAAVNELMCQNDTDLLTKLDQKDSHQQITTLIRPLMQQETKRVIAKTKEAFVDGISFEVEHAEFSESTTIVLQDVGLASEESGFDGIKGTGLGVAAESTLGLTAGSMSAVITSGFCASLAIPGSPIILALAALFSAIGFCLDEKHKERKRQEKLDMIHNQVIPTVLQQVRQHLRKSFACYADGIEDDCETFLEEKERLVTQNLEELQTKREDKALQFETQAALLEESMMELNTLSVNIGEK